MQKYNSSGGEVPQMLKITEIAELYGLPVHFVRALVNNGEVVATRVGSKILVNFDKFGEYLNSNTLRCQENESSPKSNNEINNSPRIAPILRGRQR